MTAVRSLLGCRLEFSNDGRVGGGTARPCDLHRAYTPAIWRAQVRPMGKASVCRCAAHDLQRIRLPGVSPVDSRESHHEPYCHSWGRMSVRRGNDSPQSFWKFVLSKRDGVVQIPSERWDYRRFYDPDKRAAGRMYTKRAAFLDSDPWQFDSDFFGMSPREGTSLDPQQRLIMEVSWEALDDAGLAGRVSGQPVGVYVGAFTWDHSITSVAGAALPHVDMHTAASASFTMLSNRLAYALNLKGPALTVDTACSSSLVAFHLACQGIVNGDCEMALVGGVNMMLRPETFVMMCKGGFLAVDGRCKAFSASAMVGYEWT